MALQPRRRGGAKRRAPFVPNVEARRQMDDNQVDEFKEAFRVFDVDGGGTIDSEEYQNLMEMLGMTSDPEVLTEMFVAMDADEDGELQMEAVDGGTTATIIALLDGATLVHAQVGDSSALLGGVIGGEDGGEGEVAFEELMEEHAATNVKEYERVHEQSGSRGRKLRFVYDVQVGAPHSRQTPSGRPLSALWTFSERSLSAL